MVSLEFDCFAVGVFLFKCDQEVVFCNMCKTKLKIFLSSFEFKVVVEVDSVICQIRIGEVDDLFKCVLANLCWIVSV